MEFKDFSALLQKHIKKMAKDQKYLFKVDLDKETIWNMYLDSFPPGTNEIFRERREYDCSACRHFIRDFGRVVSIKNQEVVTIWDFDAKSEVYQPVVDALSALVKSRPVVDVFIPTDREIGVENNREWLPNGETRTWYHLYTDTPRSLIMFRRDEIGTVQGKMRDSKNVFQRSLEEIDPGSVDTVLELIAQKSLYKGNEWESALTQLKKHQENYLKLGDDKLKSLYCWVNSIAVGPALSRIRNHSIGVLLTDISEGAELDDAVRRYESIVAPTNYKRPKAIFTKRMIERAYETVKELGFEESLGRRYAVLEDITVPNTLFANRDAKRVMSGNVFEELAETVPEKPKNLSKVEEIGIDDFIKNVLPKAGELEVLLENGHGGNMVSLIAPQNEDSKSMLKWANNFCWAYSGNITDSMKERVKSAGGKVDGVLRFSIQWNDNNDNGDDLDAHCVEPGGNHIYFSRKLNRVTGGNLDVDIINPGGKVAVENITWPSLDRMRKGKYRFYVNCYSSPGHSKSGFSAEIEFNGNIHSFDYPEPLRAYQNIEVAEVTFDGQEFKLEERLKSMQSSREIWGLQSNCFHKVAIMMYSPNYWDEQHGIGNQHVFFMLNGCRNPDNPSGYFNEFLNEKLMEHKRVFEGLSSKMRVKDSESQLSGLGFSLTRRAELVVRVKGSFNRLLKIKF